jgi:nitrite reductase/ring-hydroxylating ferredoxin subunit
MPAKAGIQSRRKRAAEGRASFPENLAPGLRRGDGGDEKTLSRTEQERNRDELCSRYAVARQGAKLRLRRDGCRSPDRRVPTAAAGRRGARTSEDAEAPGLQPTRGAVVVRPSRPGAGQRHGRRPGAAGATLRRHRVRRRAAGQLRPHHALPHAAGEKSYSDIIIFRTASDEVFALEDKCPHKGEPLSEGIVRDRKGACPLHNWSSIWRTARPPAPTRAAPAASPCSSRTAASTST